MLSFRQHAGQQTPAAMFSMPTQSYVQFQKTWLDKPKLKVILAAAVAAYKWVKGLTVRTFIYRRLQGNQTSSGLQYEVAY